MLDARHAEISKLLQSAQATRWAYSDIKDYWETVSNPVQYGQGMGNWVPENEYAHKLLLDAIALYLPQTEQKILDLGAGSGRITKMLLEHFPDCQVILVDASQNMLNATTQTLAAYTGRYELVVGDFLGGVVDFPAESFDCIVSVFAICHGRGLGQYQQLYANLYRWLKPSSCFVCYDHVCGATGHFTTLNVAGWLEFMQEFQSKEEAEAGVLSTYQEDYPLSLHQHLTLLTEAGFPTVDVLFKRDIFGIYAGVKSSPGGAYS
jgi:tRNA (cmo5U34)-methyltransferase